MAFEISLSVDNIFQGCEISLFIVPGYPEYVVMASVLHDDVDDYFRKHIIHYDKPDYKVLSISPIAEWEPLQVVYSGGEESVVK